MASERIINEYDSTRIANAVDTLATNLADYSGTTVTPTNAMKAKLPSQTTADRIADAVETLAQNVTSAGHTIMDEAGTEYNARKNLRFNNAKITDDSANDQTIVETFSGSYNDLTDVPTSTVKSATDTFSTVNGGLLSKCEVELSPVQDLHGYDKPWAGGAGKNLLPMTVDGIKAANTSGTWSGNSYTKNDITFIIQADDGGNVTGIKINGTANANVFLCLVAYSTYNGNYILSGCPNGGSTSTYWLRMCSSTSGDFNDIGNGVAFNPQSDRNYICEIVVISGTTVDNVTFYPMIRLATETDASFAPYSNICPISGHTESKVKRVGTIEPYSERIYTIDLGGTYYGGTVDFVSGKFVVDRKCILANTLTWAKHNYSENNIYYTPNITELSDMKIPADSYTLSGIISSDYMTIVWEGAFYPNSVGIGVSGNGRICVANPNIATLTDFETSIASTQICYELATPITIDLTPTQIDALAGDNNLFAPLDAQEIEDVEYKDIFSWQDVENLVEKEESGVKIVSFANGTDEEIKAMIDAYYADEISWEEMGWNVGDTRLIHLNEMDAPSPQTSGSKWTAQDIVAVILDHDKTDLATPVNGHTKHCITVGFREIINNGYGSDGTNGIYVNGDASYDTTFKKWANLYLRTFLNSTVLNALSTSFKDMIKDTVHYCHTAYNTDADELVTDKLYLASYPQIYGAEAFTYYIPTTHTEGEQLAYYKTAANRIKKGNDNGSTGKTWVYWNGSPSSQYDSSRGYRWCIVGSAGNADYYDGSIAFGLCPIFGM